VEQTNEYIKLNSEGNKPDLIKKVKQEPKKLIELDFKNDMGMDSLTRLDERGKGKKGNFNKNKFKKRPNEQGVNNTQNQTNPEGKTPQPKPNKPRFNKNRNQNKNSNPPKTNEKKE
jgi:hypothetical protein